MTRHIVENCVDQSNSRFEFWINFLNSIKAKNLAELGVYKGDFAAKLLKKCDSIEKYYMIDPWRQLDDWNKPANKEDNVFEKFLSQTKSQTDFASEKRIILRGKTTEVVDKITDGELDYAYIDGDHTLKGISIDLIRLFPKVKDGGWIGGDDFSKTVWQHSTKYEPTLVFPFAVYFAEAVDATIYALPNSQFLLAKDSTQSFNFIDLTGDYQDTGLKEQFNPDKISKVKKKEKFIFWRP